jgi:hypothetical protein
VAEFAQEVSALRRPPRRPLVVTDALDDRLTTGRRVHGPTQSAPVGQLEPLTPALGLVAAMRDMASTVHGTTGGASVVGNQTMNGSALAEHGSPFHAPDHMPHARHCWLLAGESYIENRTPSAWRIWWYFGPKDGQLTVVMIGPHP